MRKYERPWAEPVMLETGEKIMLYGSYDVNELNPEENVDIGGDEANEFKSSLWDE